MAAVGKLAKAVDAVRPRLGVAAQQGPACAEAAAECLFPQASWGGNQVSLAAVNGKLKTIKFIAGMP